MEEGGREVDKEIVFHCVQDSPGTVLRKERVQG